MKKIPIQCSCDNGVSSAPVADSLSAGAGLRSLPGSTPQPPRRRTTSVRIRRSLSSFVHSTPAQLLVENAVLSALVERKAPSLLASAVSLVFGLVPPGPPPEEPRFETGATACLHTQEVFGPSVDRHERLSSSHQRVLVWTANGRVRRVHLEVPSSCSTGESPSPIAGPRHAALLERHVLTDSYAFDPSQRHSVSILIPSEIDRCPAGPSRPATSREAS